MDNLSRMARATDIARGAGAIVMGRKLLNKKNKTEFEEKAARAFKRTTIGTIILVALMVICTIVVTIVFLPIIGTGVSRMGRVEDGRIRYIQNDIRYVEFEEVGLEEYGLQENDKITLYFDSVTDELVEAYPTEYVEKYQNKGIGIILGNMIAWIVILIFYAIVICRMTPFGSAWTQYCMIVREKRRKLSPTANLAISVIAFIIAIIVGLPQLEALVGNIQRMQEIDRQRTILHRGLEAGENAEKMQESLDQIGEDVSSGTEGSIDDVNNAMKRIKEILDEE